MSDQSSGRASADRGLSGLGLIMQLGGTIFAAFTAMMVFYGLIMMGRMGGGGGSGKAFLYLLLIGGSGLARSVIHRSAGADLCFATAGTPDRLPARCCHAVARRGHARLPQRSRDKP